MIVKNRFVKGNLKQASSRLKAHLKYIQYRKGRDEKREFFSQDHDDLTRQAIHTDVMEHASVRMCYHTFVISPADDEPVQDLKRWTRQVLRDLQQYQGKDLHWYATVHTNTKHHHVHIVLAGLAETPEGKRASVGLYAQSRAQDGIGDIEILTRSGRAHSDYDHHKQLQATIEHLDQIPDDTTDLVFVPSKEFDPAREKERS